VVGDGALAAPDGDGHEEQVQLVDQPGLEGMGGETGPPTVMSAAADA